MNDLGTLTSGLVMTNNAEALSIGTKFIFVTMVSLVFLGFVILAIFLWLRVKILADTVKTEHSSLAVMLTVVFVVITIVVLLIVLLLLVA